MNKAEIIFFYATIVFYSISFIFRFFQGQTEGVVPATRGAHNDPYRDWFLYLGFLSHIFTIVLRCEFSGHLPIMGTYESALSDSWITVLCIIIFQKKYPEFHVAQSLALFLSIILMLYGLLFPTAYIPLTISEQSPLVDIHALFAWMGYGNYVIAFGAALEILLQKEQTHKLNNPIATSTESGLPLLNDIIFYVLCLGFFFLSLMMATGIYYNFVLFGKWWRWDPIETSALISWLVSALVIHTKLFYGWKGKKFAILVIVSCLFIIILYKVFPLLPRAVTFHNFDLTF